MEMEEENKTNNKKKHLWLHKLKVSMVWGIRFEFLIIPILRLEASSVFSRFLSFVLGDSRLPARLRSTCLQPEWKHLPYMNPMIYLPECRPTFAVASFSVLDNSRTLNSLASPCYPLLCAGHVSVLSQLQAEYH